MVDVEVEVELDGMLLAKLSTDGWEVNVRGSAAEFAALTGIRRADWAAGGSIRAGTVVGVPAFWSVDDQVASLVIGSDDQVWDVAVSLPIDAVDELCRQAAELAG